MHYWERFRMGKHTFHWLKNELKNPAGVPAEVIANLKKKKSTVTSREPHLWVSGWHLVCYIWLVPIP
ncbi:hypothetical protein DUNSADRAFT_4179 [Dunaliella salina]|uniref:Encoded protein n=1 Tax=Dunaliella salina TaxID=3046 RepID=A0ABQ7FUW9_DUNSA|nr:hypothetical protein DUNSADRAFT_4179 [Dunaliella salina]|eukprot:KAF5826200.1 hypothetical protein DUNSADRAFT_4179 [Dunaliella salina]